MVFIIAAIVVAILMVVLQRTGSLNMLFSNAPQK